MLQQASKEQTGLLSPKELTTGITPSLAALDDAPALRQREWRRGEPGENIPHQYSATSGHLTPTPPSHESMRMDTTLNATPEGSLGNLPAAVVVLKRTGKEHIQFLRKDHRRGALLLI